jgi:hypothetical protein
LVLGKTTDRFKSMVVIVDVAPGPPAGEAVILEAALDEALPAGAVAAKYAAAQRGLGPGSAAQVRACAWGGAGALCAMGERGGGGGGPGPGQRGASRCVRMWRAGALRGGTFLWSRSSWLP